MILFLSFLGYFLSLIISELTPKCVSLYFVGNLSLVSKKTGFACLTYFLIRLFFDIQRISDAFLLDIVLFFSLACCSYFYKKFPKARSWIWMLSPIVYWFLSNTIIFLIKSYKPSLNAYLIFLAEGLNFAFFSIFVTGILSLINFFMRKGDIYGKLGSPFAY